MSRRRKRRKGSLPKHLAICTDCALEATHFRHDFYRAAPPRCMRCGGMLILKADALKLNRKPLAPARLQFSRSTPQQSNLSEAATQPTNDNPTGKSAATGLVLDVADPITARGHYSLIGHAKESG